MPYFGAESKANLATAHPDLQRLFNEVIKHWDCKVTSGLRTTAEQRALYNQGRTTPGGIVTNTDGVVKRSNHQARPGESFGRAVDVSPYPIDWGDYNRFYAFAGCVIGISKMMGINVRWGGDWDSDRDFRDQKFNDLPHFELP